MYLLLTSYNQNKCIVLVPTYDKYLSTTVAWQYLLTLHVTSPRTQTTIKLPYVSGIIIAPSSRLVRLASHSEIA